MDKENCDYEEINGELYLRATALGVIIGMLHKDDYEDLLRDGLGLDEYGDRI